MVAKRQLWHLGEFSNFESRLRKFCLFEGGVWMRSLPASRGPRRDLGKWLPHHPRVHWVGQEPTCRLVGVTEASCADRMATLLTLEYIIAHRGGGYIVEGQGCPAEAMFRLVLEVGDETGQPSTLWEYGGLDPSRPAGRGGRLLYRPTGCPSRLEEPRTTERWKALTSPRRMPHWKWCAA